MLFLKCKYDLKGVYNIKLNNLIISCNPDYKRIDTHQYGNISHKAMMYF